MQGNKKPNAKTKICYVITKGVWGGAQKYVYTLATSLPKEKFEVLVIMGEGGILKNKLHEKGIRTYELNHLKRDISLKNEFYSSLNLLKIVRKESPDVLHLNSPKASGFGAVAGILCRTPKIIQTIHGWSFNENRNFISKMLIFFFSWLTTLMCHKTIVIADKEKKQALAMWKVSSSKITLIKNGVEEIQFINRAIVREALLNRAHLKKQSKKLWIGTICELHRNKGLEFALKALTKLKDPFLYFIVGEGEERLKLQNLIREYGLGNKVFLLGAIADAKIYLKAFDVFVLPSVKEGLPYTILEAGLAGLPVIASHTGGIPDIIDDGENGILTRAGDSSQITRAIEYFIAHPEKQKEFGLKIQEKVKKEFSIEDMLKKTIKLYR